MAVYEKTAPNPRGDLYYYKLEVTENSVDVENNTSNVTAVLSFKGPYNPSLSGWTMHSGIQLVGAQGVIQATADPAPTINTAYRELMRMTADVPHNTDGRLNLVCRAWIYNSSFGDRDYMYAPNWFSDSNTPSVMGILPLTELYHDPVWGDVSDFYFEDTIELPCSHSSLTDELRMSIDGYVFAVRNNWRSQSITLDADELVGIYDYILRAAEYSTEVEFTMISRDGEEQKAAVTTTATGTVRGQIYKKGVGYGVLCIKNGSNFFPGVLTNGGKR